jgi:hypothetical protein
LSLTIQNPAIDSATPIYIDKATQINDPNHPYPNRLNSLARLNIYPKKTKPSNINHATNQGIGFPKRKRRKRKKKIYIYIYIYIYIREKIERENVKLTYIY